jgi:hypothetical protein
MAKKREIMDRLTAAVDALSSAYRAYEAAPAAEPMPTGFGKLLAQAAEVVDIYDEILEWEDQKTAGTPHPDADYYDVKLGDGTSISRSRCKKCGSEMDPKAIRRHLKGAACGKRIEQRSKKSGEAKSPETPAAS